MCLIADTPEGTTKLELRLEARFALRLLYDVSIVAPVDCPNDAEGWHCFYLLNSEVELSTSKFSARQ